LRRADQTTVCIVFILWIKQGGEWWVLQNFL
jgi:hypothetical protein